MPFTKENAVSYGLKGVEARRANMLKHGEAKNSMALPPVQTEDSDSYRAKRLARVRRQLDMVDSEVWKEASKNPEGKRLKELVEAQNRLDAQEWSLSNRHKPSVAKPTGKPPKKYPDHEPQFSVIHEAEPIPTKPIEIPTPISTNTGQSVPPCTDGDGI